MKHTHHGGHVRRYDCPDEQAEHPPREHGHGEHGHGKHWPAEHRHRGHRRGGHRGARAFDYGELRILALAMIADRPSHGYELMKAIEERMAGTYSPSPGVMYPTLSWLEDMGYARVEASDGRKRYHATAEGQAFLAANRPSLDALLARMGGAEAGAAGEPPAPVLRGMENLKLALRLRLRRGPVDAQAAAAIADALDAAAQAVERT